MNKLTLKSIHTPRTIFYRAMTRLRSLAQFARQGLAVRSKPQSYRPQWQQLELPFTRTPVTRWNRW